MFIYTVASRSRHRLASLSLVSRGTRLYFSAYDAVHGAHGVSPQPITIYIYITKRAACPHFLAQVPSQTTPPVCVTV